LALLDSESLLRPICDKKGSAILWTAVVDLAILLFWVVKLAFS
jgi:hypothetical protein